MPLDGATGNFGGDAGVVDRETPQPSTFRHGVGQVVPLGGAPTLTPKSGSRVVLSIMAGVALAGLVIVLASRSKGRQTRPAVAAETGGHQFQNSKAPSAVRINFMSDPDGATVTRVDSGSVLGTTPLSLEVPYSDSAVEFVLRKAGYEDKPMIIVPNLPAPMFASLRPLSGDPASLAAAGRKGGKKRPNQPPGKHKTADDGDTPVASPVATPKKLDKRSASSDDDAVLEPDFK